MQIICLKKNDSLSVQTGYKPMIKLYFIYYAYKMLALTVIKKFKK